MESMRVKPVGTGNFDKLKSVPDDPLRLGGPQSPSMETHRERRMAMTSDMTISRIVALRLFSSRQ